MEKKQITFEEIEDLRSRLIHLECALTKYGMNKEAAKVFELTLSIVMDYDTEHSSYSECLSMLSKHSDLIQRFDKDI